MRFPAELPPATRLILLTAMQTLQHTLSRFLVPNQYGMYLVPLAAQRALLAEDPTDALYEHAFVGNILACAILLARGVDVDYQPVRHLHNTALHAACSGLKDNDDMVRFLLMHGASVNRKNATGKTPLHLACERGHHATANLLLRYEADHSLQDNHYQDTPLHTACRYGHATLVAPLLRRSADVKAVDRAGHTPLQLALVSRHQTIIDLLRTHGATE